MFREKDSEIIKEYAKAQLGTYKDGVMFALVQNNQIIWKISSRDSKFEGYQEGTVISNRTIEKAIRMKQIESEKVFDEIVQNKVHITAVPVMEDTNEECQSAFVTIMPVIHPLESAFQDIAPIIAEIFREGSLISITNKTEVLQVQRSEIYDIPAVVPGFDITDTPVDTQALSTGKCAHADDDSLIYGPPIRVLAGPYFDHDTKEVVGVINILRPKQAELSLKDMSVNLERQLSEVLITVQEVAAASSTIHTNEQEVNMEIEKITELAKQIVQISNLIKSIADSTKMLGLNASIESARAGAAGRGFSVVATEINKLSEQSKNTVLKIKNLTDDIIAKVEESKLKSQMSLDSSQEQVAATEEITATIEDIQTTSIELANIAGRI